MGSERAGHKRCCACGDAVHRELVPTGRRIDSDRRGWFAGVPEAVRAGSGAGTKRRGLRIVEALSTAWGVTHKVTGKSAWATFDVGTLGAPPAEAGAPA